MSISSATDANRRPLPGTGWGSSQQIRLEWERDAFSRMLDQNDTMASDPATAGSTEESAQASRPGSTDFATSGIPESTDFPGRAAVAYSRSEPMKSPANLREFAIADGGVPGEPVAAPTPQQVVRSPAESAEKNRVGQEIPRESNAAADIENSTWVAVRDEQLHIAVRVPGDDETLRAKLSILATELGWRSTNIKINGVPHSVKAIAQEQDHGS